MPHLEQLPPKPTWVRRPAGAGPRLVHVSASATAGGIADLLWDLVPAQATTGMSVGWAVLGGDAPFFAVAKQLRRLLQDRGDASGTVRLRAGVDHYRAVLEFQAERLADRLTPGDVVVLHDPAPLGMAPALAAAGVRPVWHCHTGTESQIGPGPSAVWATLGPELSTLDSVLATLPEFTPPSVPLARWHVATPAIDPRGARNIDLTVSEQRSLLAETGLTGDGAEGTTEQDRPLPADAPVVLQLSAWDVLKDMRGVLRLVSELPPEVHVVLAGPPPDEIPHDPDAAADLDDVRAARDRLSPSVRARTHLVLVPGRDRRRRDLTVNALQRRADVVLHKSLAEGFGLPVTEAMYKGKAVVAADVGGLRQQISPGHNGLLVDPRNVGSVAETLRLLLDHPLLRRRLGRHATESTTRRYLLPRLVSAYAALVAPAAARATA